jgi:demethylmenaquinone methyltransferase/2-methoxy-6-polyprenyl-1,4-benzoquinol methylase
VSEFPSGEQLANVLREVGLKNVQWRPMTFGVVTLYTGTK